MRLQDDILTLRAPEPEDLERLYRWENDAALWEAGSTVAPFSKRQLWEYIKNYDGDLFTARQLRLIAVENATGEAVGIVDLYDFDPLNLRAFVGLLIDKTRTGRGYGHRALTILSGYCRERLGLHQLSAVISADNGPSIKAFARAGFEVTARLTEWLKTGEGYADAFLYRCLL